MTIQSSNIHPPLILALDIGSSSARAALVDGRGGRVPGSLIDIRYRKDTISSAYGSLDPQELMSDVEALIDQLLAKLDGTGAEIAAVGISTFWHSLMGIDAQGDPRTAVLMWSDVRAARHCEKFEAALNPVEYHERTGTPVHSSYPAVKLLWLKAEQPDVWDSVARWLSFGEYLLRSFCGEEAVSVSMASATGLFNQSRLDWDGPTLELLKLNPGQLSPVSDQAMTHLNPEYAKRWSALRRASWFPALGDGACANVGSSAIGKGRAALSVGTSGAMRLLWRGDPVPPPDGLWLYRLDANRVLLGGALSEGGNLWEWVNERFRIDRGSDLVAKIAAIPPDSHGLTWLPFLAGERSTGWSRDATGVISGLTLHTTSPQILRAGMEAIAYRFALIAQRLNHFTEGDYSLIGSGNALISDSIWPQMMSDAIGHELIESPEPEASMRGAALVALERIGAIRPVDQSANDEFANARRFSPDAERHHTYLAGLARQQELYRRLMT